MCCGCQGSTVACLTYKRVGRRVSRLVAPGPAVIHANGLERMTKLIPKGISRERPKAARPAKRARRREGRKQNEEEERSSFKQAHRPTGIDLLRERAPLLRTAPERIALGLASHHTASPRVG